MSDQDGKDAEPRVTGDPAPDIAKSSPARPRPPLIEAETHRATPGRDGAPTAEPKPSVTATVGSKPSSGARSEPPAAATVPEARSPGAGLAFATLTGAALATVIVLGLGTAGWLPTGDAARIDALESDVVRLQDALTTARETQTSNPRLDQRLADLDARLTSLSTAPQTADTGSAEGVARIEDRLKALEQATEGLTPRIEAKTREQDEAIAVLGTRLDQLMGELRDLASAAKNSQVQPAAQGIEAAIALSATAALEGALARGASYTAELDAVAALFPQADTAALRIRADTGLLPSPAIAAAWRASFDDAPPPAPPANASFVDKLWANAKALVRTTPLGEPEGDAPEAIRARFLGALSRADLVQAMENWRKFDAGTRAATAEPAHLAESRLAAENAAAALRRDALDTARALVTSR